VVTQKELSDPQSATDALGVETKPVRPERLRLVVDAGPDAGRELDLVVGTYIVGKSPLCELALSDSSVSRRHLEITVHADGLQLRDLGSTNGSFFQGARFDSMRVGKGATLTIGHTELSVMAPYAQDGQSTSSSNNRCGGLLGASASIRQVFALLSRVAPTDVGVLIQGETGTGKELVAEAIHAKSSRKRGPFVICDLASMPRTLIESELFGHVRGAFTGADRDREGAFGQAHGGTIFLDEIGELEPDVQPRLLRALERHQYKPVGSSAYRECDVRIIAATNRDLAVEVRAGRFREDLFHRLAVVRVELPPLRERRDDIPLLTRHFLAQASAQARRVVLEVPDDAMAALAAYDWPGNVRELKNVLERAFSLAPHATFLDTTLLGLEELTPRPFDGAPSVDTTVPFKEAKDRLILVWEREYVQTLVTRAEGNVSLAARRAGIDRVYLHRLMKKHGLSG
jgi:DNA-binding NtrC family response regulator